MADLDGDGYTELVIGNRVFAAETGKLLCTATGNSGTIAGWSTDNFMIQTAIADVPELGTQQICIGNAIYGVTISNRNGTVGNSMTALKTLSPISMHDNTSPPASDGVTQAVDFDLDGHLDVIVSTIDQTGRILYTYVWSPHKNEIIASKKLNSVFKASVPFVGNISGSQYPEIVYVHGNSSNAYYISALSYNTAATDKQLSLLWQIPHLDSSGTTGITLFDFNQDGISEPVYRDEQQLRIINGSLKSHITGNDTVAVYNLVVYPCISGTSHEYPTIADIDNDGQAELIVAGPVTSSVSFVQTVVGPIRIFKAGVDTKWAPTRKVWNQFSYNAVNVNEDLTIPRYPMNPATFFPGKDGILHTADDIQPFNNFLQQ
jgi:hypothetical protein